MAKRDRLAEIRRRYKRRMAFCRQPLDADAPVSLDEVCKTDDESRLDIGYLLRRVRRLERELREAKGE